MRWIKLSGTSIFEQSYERKRERERERKKKNDMWDTRVREWFLQKCIMYECEVL